MNYFNYFTEIENHFVQKRGKHLLLSPMDWNLIAVWREAGIPLQVALRGIEIAMDGFFARRQRGAAKVNTLCYCHDSVMAEFARYQESRVGASSDPKPDEASAKDESAREEALQFLSERIHEINALVEERRFSESVLESIHRAQSRLEEIFRNTETGAGVDLEALERDLGIAEAILIEGLHSAVPAEQAARWEQEAKTELKIYKKRLPSETFEQIHHNYLKGQIRRHFNIGEWSVIHL